MGDIYIVLQNKMIFKGKSFGAEGEALGELVFTTGMGGYIETLTDPSYYGQIVVQTFPLIGNYGMISEDFESAHSAVKAYVVREHCDNPSNFRCEMTLDDYLKKEGIVGVFHVDTRELTKVIREHGVMNAKITTDLSSIDYDELKNYKIIDAVSAVSSGSHFRENRGAPRRIALLDYGVKGGISRELTARGCEVIVCPHTYTAEKILALNPHGVMLSNGPGNPADNEFEIGVIRELLGKLPVFGICLGHQLLALAAGGQTVKLKYGHRGQNQPVKCIETGRVYITSQNHGYAVDASTLTNGTESFFNANDGTNEGMDYPSLQAFSVQFHPEACAGPLDVKWLFDKFMNTIDANLARQG